MSAVDDVDKLIEQFNPAQGEVVKGNPEPALRLFSHRDDVTLANPLAPPVRGWERVAEIAERAASQFRDGEMVAFENLAKHVPPEFAYVVRVERARAKVGGSEEVAPLALRVTMIFRSEDGEWRIVHRHADPITTAQPAESVIQQLLRFKTELPRTRFYRKVGG